MPTITTSHQDDFEPAGTPARFYALCTSARSGSTLLANLLWSTDRMGAPDEHSNLNKILRLQKVFLCDGIAEYTNEVLRRRTSPNGVFGMKLHYNHWHTFQHCRRFTAFKNLKLIQLQKRDRIAQAASVILGMQTQQFVTDRPAKGSPRYDFRVPRSALLDLKSQDRSWSTVFSRLGVRPFTGVYEELCADPESHVANICRFVGVDPNEPAVSVNVRIPARKASAINAEWAERFRTDLAHRREQRVPKSAAVET